MKTAIRVLPILAVAAVVLWGTPSLAFHDEGVAHCNGCHTMHNSEDGMLVDASAATGNPFLLVDATPSDLCLGCHTTSGSRGVLSGDCNAGPTTPQNGAGNFIFLGCANVAETTRGSAIPGWEAGHNINAPGHGIAPDPTLAMAPGGTFPSTQMACTSCHDPHGTGAFRLLYGVRIVQGSYAFTNPAPMVIKKGSGAEAPDNHNAYLGGMSAWCGNCHQDFDQIGASHKHVAGVPLGATISTTYNMYNGSADIFGGTAATAYWPEVPFEDPTMTTTSTQGPTASSAVMCLTCHRAHATSAANAGRWDFAVSFNEEDGDAFGTFELAQRISNLTSYAQRSLCNKCHAQDLYDEIKNDGGPY